MQQKISAFHLDAENHWVADLECGHRQHVRHDPPWMVRPWVLSEEGRGSRIGTELDCKRCDEVGAAIAGAARSALWEIAQEQYRRAALRGLDREGQWEAAMNAMRTADLTPVIERAMRARG